MASKEDGFHSSINPYGFERVSSLINLKEGGGARKHLIGLELQPVSTDIDDSPNGKLTYPKVFTNIKPDRSGIYLPEGSYEIQNTNSLDPVDELPDEDPEVAQRMMSGFKKYVDDLDFQAVALPTGDKPIPDIERFRLIPIVGNPRKYATTKTPAYYDVSLPDGVVSNYQDANNNPYLDANQAIGLVYGDNLIAVASAYVDGAGNIVIVQLQDVTSVRKSDDRKRNKKYYSTGLHNGLLWRDTLVRAWEEVALQVGSLGLEIKSHKNNKWPLVRESGKTGYDDVAERMGFVQDFISGDWRISLLRLNRTPSKPFARQ